MSSNYTVVFDANVLYPAELRSFLMYVAVSEEFRARWSADIHEEWIRNVLLERPDLSREQLEGVRDRMDSHVPGCVVSGYESLIPSIELPDPDDRHVVACAIKTRAEAIVTFNLKDFPKEVLGPLDIVAIHPDQFVSELATINAAAVIEGAQLHRRSLRNPPFTVQAYLDLLQKQRLPETVAFLRRYEAIL
ncbi:putative nucleic acid-binding protein [Litorivivens lipolytica]|uniref:Putative nucleic acid-binding protein n=1 Tax=Litorivivens lipolytica TaxID=1524264 RepID=A0A7W4Z8F4_9GAMM|nr:PIN domain-containing protein [Litorivivens lipolytica]MBB3048965.1 putative nucleic acid-binding protein [Litorivivens lipolytica]